MKLFIFEGQKREPRIFKTIQWLYFKENDQLIFSFCNNIHNLYKELHDVFEGEGDIVSVLRESAIKRGDHSLDEITTSSDVLLNFKICPMGAKAVLDSENVHYAGWFAGQLNAYQAALEAAGEKVIKRYIYYPVSGLLVKAGK